MSAPPRAFVSHSHDDKAIAGDLALRLRGLGVDAWVDKWEIRPGDSLIQKIFEEGIKGCKVFLILLSKSSVQSKWVREELDVAMVRRLDGATRVVPVLLEHCEIPMALRALLWIDLQIGREEAARKIADVAFDRWEVPPIAEVPTSFSVSVPGLTSNAARLAVHLSGSLDDPSGSVPGFEGKVLSKVLAVSPTDINDAVEELASRGLVLVRRYIGTAPYNFGMVEPTYALGLFLRGTSALSYDPEEDVLVVASAVAASGDLDGDSLTRLTGLSAGRINHAVKYLEEYGIAEAIHYMGTAPYDFGSVSATGATRRFVAENAK